MAAAIDASSTPTATMLWLSCATLDAMAPCVKPKFLINAFAIGAVWYLLTTTIFKISFVVSVTQFPFCKLPASINLLVMSCPSSASITGIKPFLLGYSFAGMANVVGSIFSQLKLLIAFVGTLLIFEIPFCATNLPIIYVLVTSNCTRSLTKIKSAASPGFNKPTGSL